MSPPFLTGFTGFSGLWIAVFVSSCRVSDQGILSILLILSKMTYNGVLARVCPLGLFGHWKKNNLPAPVIAEEYDPDRVKITVYTDSDQGLTNRPKVPQGTPKVPQEAIGSAPKTAQGAPKVPQAGPKSAQGVPRVPQECPKS